MAEASALDEITPRSKGSPNGAAGPSSNSDVSIASTEDMSIHLSPRESTKRVRPSPKPTKTATMLKSTSARTKPSTVKSSKTATTTDTAVSKVKLVKTFSSDETMQKMEQTFAAPKQPKRQSDKYQPKEKCDMCDEMRVMVTRCLNCQSSLCMSCTDHHRKMKISADHELQDWQKFMRTINPDPPPPPPSKQMCKIHKQEKLQFYCKQCLQPLCTNCKLTKHEGHKTKDLYEEIQEQREILPMKLSQIRASFLPLMKQQMKELEDYEHELSYNVKVTTENIEKRTKIVKDEIDRTSKRLVDKLKQKKQKENDRVNLRKQVLGNFVRNATMALSSGDRVVQSGDDFEVMELYQTLIEMLRKMDEITKRKPGKTRYIFQDGKMSKQQLDTMFGNYTEKGPTVARQPRPRQTPALQHVPEIHPRLLNTFQCKMVPGNKVSAIAPINDNEAWISFGWTTNEIYLYNKDGHRRNRLMLRNPVDDVAVDREGNLLVSTFSGNIVRIVDRRMQARDFFQCPLKCRGLVVSSAGEIVVCGVDMCTALPPPAKCTIFKFTAKGNKTGHLDGDKTKRIPIHPYRVAENIDGSLAVSDWVNDKEGRVVVFSHDGKIRMVYYGQSHEARSFLPYGIATDKYGHILVGDVINSEVHLLDIKGHFLRILLTKAELGGEKPYYLAIDPTGMLWVGNERAYIKIFRYLLNQSHIVSPSFDEMRSEWQQDDWSPRYPPRYPALRYPPPRYPPSYRSSYPQEYYYEEPVRFPPYLTSNAFTRWVFGGESSAGRGKTGPSIPRYKKSPYKHVPYSWDWRLW